MNKLFLLIVFFFNIHAYELSESYQYHSTTLYSDDLFPNLPKKFEILQIPANKTIYRVEANVILKSFELHGIQIEANKIRYVNFIKYSPIDFSSLKLQLSTLLKDHYPSIEIESITIYSRGYLPSLPKETRGIFDERFYQNAIGTFYILDAQGLRHYLDYSVSATLAVLHTTQKVSRKEKLTGFNTLLKPIPYKTFKDKPLTALPDAPSRYRSSLKPGQLLTLRNIETVPLVLKNSQVIVEVQNDSVVVEFGATATQEGLLYDIITIQKNDGKRSKAKVIGENRVELQ